ncbi:MAG: hypothetical protein MHM6MM_007574 [Cercozoa sp. M6MM]
MPAVLCLVVLAVTCVAADNLVPLSVMKPGCVHQGKCVDDHGLFNPSVCCSGVCDKDNGCVSTTEASSILIRATATGTPFVCKPDLFFGVRCGEPSYFQSGSLPPDCLCPEGKPCLIGNDDTALCSTRFWLGKCDPSNSACVPQLQISVDLEKTLFEYPKPTLDNGLGGQCTVSSDCLDPDLVCTSTCLVDIADSLFGTAPGDGFQVTADQSRDLGDSSVCALAPAATVGFNTPCLCNSDCNEGKCMVLLANNLDDMTEAIDDTSLVGLCLLGPGDSGCSLKCHCLPGSDCIAGDCSIPAGSPVDCTSGTCTPPAFCDSGLCKLPGGAPCVSSLQCASGNCDPTLWVCAVPPPSTLDPCTRQRLSGRSRVREWHLCFRCHLRY